MINFIKTVKPRRGIISRLRAKKGRIPARVTEEYIRSTHFRFITLTEAPENVLGSMVERFYEKQTQIFPADRETIQNHPALFPDFNFVLSSYVSRQTVNFGLAAVSDAIKRREITVMLIDRAGECMGVAAEFLRLCRVRVLTDRPENYRACAEYTALKYGMPPEMCTPDSCDQSDLILAPLGLCGYSLPTNGRPVLSSDPSDGVFYPDDEFIHVPFDLLAACPKGIDPVFFAAGMYFEAEYDDIFYLLPKKVKKRNLYYSISDFSEILAPKDITNN